MRKILLNELIRNYILENVDVTAKAFKLLPELHISFIMHAIGQRNSESPRIRKQVFIMLSKSES